MHVRRTCTCVSTCTCCAIVRTCMYMSLSYHSITAWFSFDTQRCWRRSCVLSMPRVSIPAMLPWRLSSRRETSSASSLRNKYRRTSDWSSRFIRGCPNIQYLNNYDAGIPNTQNQLCMSAARFMVPPSHYTNTHFTKYSVY